MGFKASAEFEQEVARARRCLEHIQKGEAPARIRLWLDRRIGEKGDDRGRDRVLTMYATLLYGEMDARLRTAVIADRLIRAGKVRVKK